MEIELKNGENIILEVSPLLLEYIEDYDGGIEQLLKDAKGTKNSMGLTSTMYATNHLLYAIIASNYDEQLTYRQAVRLVRLEDIAKIIDFMSKNIPLINKQYNNTTLHNKIKLHKM